MSDQQSEEVVEEAAPRSLKIKLVLPSSTIAPEILSDGPLDPMVLERGRKGKTSWVQRHSDPHTRMYFKGTE